MKNESAIKLSELLKEHQLQCCVVPSQQECTFTYDSETGTTTFDFNFSENKICSYLVDFSILDTMIAGQCIFYLIRTDQYYSSREFELLSNNNANLNNVISHYGANNSIFHSKSQFKNATYVSYIDSISITDKIDINDSLIVIARFIENYVTHLTGESVEIISAENLSDKHYAC